MKPVRNAVASRDSEYEWGSVKKRTHGRGAGSFRRTMKINATSKKRPPPLARAKQTKRASTEPEVWNPDAASHLLDAIEETLDIEEDFSFEGILELGSVPSVQQPIFNEPLSSDTLEVFPDLKPDLKPGVKPSVLCIQKVNKTSYTPISPTKIVLNTKARAGQEISMQFKKLNYMLATPRQLPRSMQERNLPLNGILFNPMLVHMEA